jgi:hypothetical protein
MVTEAEETSGAGATLRLELQALETEVTFSDMRLAANTADRIVIVLANEAGERVSIVLPKRMLKDLVNWKTVLSL